MLLACYNVASCTSNARSGKLEECVYVIDIGYNSKYRAIEGEPRETGVVGAWAWFGRSLCPPQSFSLSMHVLYMCM